MRRLQAWFRRKRCRNRMAAENLARMFWRAYGDGSPFRSRSGR